MCPKWLKKKRVGIVAKNLPESQYSKRRGDGFIWSLPGAATVSPWCPHWKSEPVITWRMMMAADWLLVCCLHICPLKCNRSWYILLSEGFLSRCIRSAWRIPGRFRHWMGSGWAELLCEAVWGCLTTVGVILAKFLMCFIINIINLWIFGTEMSSCSLRIPLILKDRNVHIFSQALC